MLISSDLGSSTVRKSKQNRSSNVLFKEKKSIRKLNIAPKARRTSAPERRGQFNTGMKGRGS